MSGSQDSVIPSNEISIDVDEALEEAEPVVDALSDDISGIGQKAAERYLLQYEYGMATKDLASEFDVTPQTISNQVSLARTKILKYPRLARMIGKLRVHRTNLSQPDIEDGHTWEGKTELKGEPIQYGVEYKAGNPGRPYSWCYSCESRYEHDTRIYHLFEDYLIDAVHGVFLKRLMEAFSLKSWNRPPMGKKYEYTAYPLPNLEIPNNRSGSLLDATEYHWAYDTKNHFEKLVTEDILKGDLEERAEDGEMPLKGNAHYAREEVLSDRIRNRNASKKAIENYTETVHIRDKIEKLLRTYPLDAPFDLPTETVTQLWNGQPTDLYSTFRTSDINKQPLYSVTITANGRHRSRDIYVSGTEHNVEMPYFDDSYATE